MAKRYYWLKLPDDFFQQKAIKKLRKIAGGDTYTIIYLKMLLIAIKQDGKLFFEGVEDNFSDEIALEIDEDPDNVKIAVAYLQGQGLIETVEADEYNLPEAAKMTGSESASAERMRRMRDKRASQCDIEVTQRLRLGDVEIEIEKEKEIEKDKRYKTFCPELEKSTSGPELTTEDPTVVKGAKEIGTASEDGVKGIDAGAGKMVEKAAEPSPEVFIQLPLNTGEMFNVTVPYVEEKKRLFPAVDVEQELRAMRSWLDDNPRNRKTAGGVKRFINGWLAKEQNRAPRDSRNQSSVQKKNRFNNFHQRDYNYPDLESQLLRQQAT